MLQVTLTLQVTLQVTVGSQKPSVSRGVITIHKTPHTPPAFQTHSASFIRSVYSCVFNGLIHLGQKGLNIRFRHMQLSVLTYRPAFPLSPAIGFTLEPKDEDRKIHPV